MESGRRSLEASGGAWLAHRSRMRVLGFDDQLIREDLRIAQHFLASEHWSAWNVVSFERGEPLARSFGSEDFRSEIEALI